MADTWFEITYRDVINDEVVSVRARTISDSALGLSFVSISDFVFSSDSVVVNPKDEALATRLADVKTLHLPIYHILSIAEIGRENTGISLEQDRSNLLMLPNRDETEG